MPKRQTTLDRVKRHVSKNRWWYGLASIAAGTIVTLATTAIWNHCSNKVFELHEHYLQSETNTIRLNIIESFDLFQIREEITNINERWDRMRDTNRLIRSQILELQKNQERTKH